MDLAQIKPPSPQGNSSPYSIIYKWRLEQEHYMKAHNGGMGMTDEEVVSYVQPLCPFIPCCLMFNSSLRLFTRHSHLDPK
jgi:pantothenate kinase-related protein Tda10